MLVIIEEMSKQINYTVLSIHLIIASLLFDFDDELQSTNSMLLLRSANENSRFGLPRILGTSPSPEVESSAPRRVSRIVLLF